MMGKRAPDLKAPGALIIKDIELGGMSFLTVSEYVGYLPSNRLLYDSKETRRLLVVKEVLKLFDCTRTEKVIKVSRHTELLVTPGVGATLILQGAQPVPLHINVAACCTDFRYDA